MVQIKVLAICYYGRSGSVFFQSLFDGHPECVTTPGTYISGYQDWFNELKDLSTDAVIDNFCERYKVFFNPYYISDKPLPCCGSSPGFDLNFHKMGELQNQEILIDESIFRENLKKYTKKESNQTDISFFVSLHFAYAQTRGIDVDQLKWIIFPLHSSLPARAKFLSSLDARIIHVIREPIQAAVSLHKHAAGKSPFGLGLNGIVVTMAFRRTLPGFENVTTAVKLEDIHTQPEKTLRMICKFLGLTWDEALLKSTFGGKQWWNLQGTDNVTGFNKVIIGKKHEDAVSEKDRKKFQYLFRKVYRNWEYPHLGLRVCNIFSLYKIEKNASIKDIISARYTILRTILSEIRFLRKLTGKRQLSEIPLLKRITNENNS